MKLLLTSLFMLQAEVLQLPEWADSLTTKSLLVLAIWYFANQLNKKQDKIDNLTDRIMDIEKTNAEVITDVKNSYEKLTNAIDHLTDKIEMIINAK